MEHIKTPVYICDSELTNLYYVRDADGCRLTTKLSLDEARELRDVLNAHDDLLTALVRAEQTLRNLAQSGALDYDYIEIAENEAENLRRDIARAKGQ